MAIILIDTNILVYSVDRGERAKQTKSIELLDYLQPTGSACLSVQCLAEFFTVTTKSIQGRHPMLTPLQAVNQVEHLGRAFTTLELTFPIIREATRGALEFNFHYYDAQIWAMARLHQIPVILSEDFQHQQTVEGVQFLNPFDDDFNLSKWL